MLGSMDPQQASICNPPGSRLFIVCGRSVEGMWSFQRGAGHAVRVRGVSHMLFCAEATLQAAFAPFGVIQNIKLIKEKGVSSKTAAAAARTLPVTAAWPCFHVSDVQQGPSAAERRRVGLISLFVNAIGRMGAPRLVARDPFHQQRVRR
jgi:hypothetical protein